MWKLKRKKKPNIGITTEEMRRVVKEELMLADDNRQKIDEEEKKKILARQRFNSLPLRYRLKLLRYVKEKREKNGEK